MPNLEGDKFKFWFYNNFYGNYEIGEGTRIGSFCDIGGMKA